MSIGTFIVIFAPEGMFIMIRPNRKVPLELLLWGTNKRLQPKGLSTNNSRGPGKHRNKPTTTNRYNTKNHKRTWTTRTPDESELNSGDPEE
jgi:hypothetical protein